MISQNLRFKFFERGFKETLVLIPGWATDYRIFSRLELEYNYLIQVDFDPVDFKERLLEELDIRALDKVSLFGWSLGGFLAAEFAKSYCLRVNELILVSIREKFDPAVLKDTRAKLIENKKAFLYKFYLEWFSANDKKELSWFKKNLLMDYAKGMELRDLLAGLDYLNHARIDAQALSALKKITIFHGSLDKIMPLDEALSIKQLLAKARFICMDGVGHIPFLKRDFTREFKG